jgi:hypothetical protein
MTLIRQLAAVTDLTDGDQFPIWSEVNGDSRRAPASVVRSYMQAGLDIRSLVTAYAAPSATGFTVTLTGTSDLWLVLTPTATFAAGTIVLPSAPVDHQTVEVSCTQIVTTLTVSGGTITGAPTTLAANGVFKLRFDAVMGVWRRVG